MPTTSIRGRRASRILSALSVAMLVSACAAPVGIRRVDPRTVQRELAENVVTTGEFSPGTRNALRFANLEDAYRERPEEVIELVHRLLLEDAQRGASVSRGALIALAEMAFRHASESGQRRYFFAAAFYAWVFLFPEDPSLQPEPFDPRLRLAADIYNRSLTLAFVEQDSDTVRLRAETVELPVGRLEVTLDTSARSWGDRRLVAFVPVSELEVRGLRNRYRRRGIGAPMAALLEPVAPDDRRDGYLPPSLRLPVAAVLRFRDVRSNLGDGVVRARLELHAAPDGDTVEIGGREIPLEMEPTSSIASMMAEENPLWREIRAFFTGTLARRGEGLTSLEPYRPGRIPVVLVHGTLSSGATWAQLVNDLSADAQIREHFQFWIFTYNTGNPIAYSGWLLRTALQDLVDTLDPKGEDPALRRMVVIGHSQGGLLAKLTVVHSGLDLWHLLSDRPPDEVELSEESRRILEGSLLVEPVPEVKRVIFIATPHRGSYVAGWTIARWVGSMVSAPASVVRAVVNVVTNDELARSQRRMRKVASAVDNMAPGNEFLLRLSTLPIAEGVTSHSIIAVEGDGDPEGGVDGVVEYESARIPDVVSEFVVPSGHSCTGHPWTIAEVRRILLEHVGLKGRGPEELNLR